MNKSDLIFCYDAKDCVPNGDPITNQQRFDPITKKIMVSDVRMKRYARDFLDQNGIGTVYLKELTDDVKLNKRLKMQQEDKNKKKKVSGAAAQISYLIDVFSEEPDIKSILDEKTYDKLSIAEKKRLTEIVMKKCIDVRAFGGISTEADFPVHFTGPIQFNLLNYSTNQIKFYPLINTTVFVSSIEKSQGSMTGSGVNIVPYAFIPIIGQINPFVAKITGLTDSDVTTVLNALWHGVNMYRSRSKTYQNSRLLLKINYKNQLTKISNLDTLISTNANLQCRSIMDLQFDFSKLKNLLESELVESIEYRLEKEFVAIFKSVLELDKISSKFKEIKDLW